MSGDPHRLQRFLDAQDEAGTYERALLGVSGKSARQILGGVDAVKLRSSMTLFARAAPEEPLFGRVLDRYFEGRPDGETLRRLRGSDETAQRPKT